MSLLQLTSKGLFCEVGGFYIDPAAPVEKAIITHAHGDHARSGSQSYLAAVDGEGVLRERVGSAAKIESIPYGESVALNGVRLSLHPAGHILGSVQVRVEYRGEVWVASGDYKVEADKTCRAFEPVRCHTFITESTFGLPIYRWQNQAEVYREINDWWRENQRQKITSVVYAYALGKAQRVLSGLEPLGPIVVQGATARMVEHYRRAGVLLPEVTLGQAGGSDGQALLIVPPNLAGTSLLKRYAPFATAFASGWMLLRKERKRRRVQRGFVLSDHADWPGLLTAIQASGAERVGVTHGASATLVRYLSEQGRSAFELSRG